MMRKTLVVAAFLTALSASAGTITSLDPSTIAARSGEYFLTINGTDLGDQLSYSGPAGNFVVDINARFTGNVVGWLPIEIANEPGTYTVTVLGGNSGDSEPATFRVVDPLKIRQPFVILLPEVLVAIAEGKMAAIRYEVIPMGGDDDPTPEVKCDPPSGSFFGVGTTTVNCLATNRFGETAKGSFSVFVHDATRPSLKLPGRLVAAAEADEGAFVKFEVSATDEVDGIVETQCDAKSGSMFPVGVTTVACLATDSSLNTARGTFTIDVVSKESRFELHVPDPIFAEAESEEGAKVEFEVYTTGTLDPTPKISCGNESGSVFPIGTTLVNCEASDSFGSFAEGKFEVTVADTTPPLIDSAVATPDRLDASGDLVPVVVEVKAFDSVDPKPQCTISYVFASEPISEKDWSLVSALEVKLNAITSDVADRVYHVEVQCTDSSRNSSFVEALVTVAGKGF
jgi:hypothetical protein